MLPVLAALAVITLLIVPLSLLVHGRAAVVAQWKRARRASASIAGGAPGAPEAQAEPGSQSTAGTAASAPHIDSAGSDASAYGQGTSEVGVSAAAEPQAATGHARASSSAAAATAAADVENSVESSLRGMVSDALRASAGVIASSVSSRRLSADSPAIWAGGQARPPASSAAPLHSAGSLHAPVSRGSLHVVARVAASCDRGTSASEGDSAAAGPLDTVAMEGSGVCRRGSGSGSSDFVEIEISPATAAGVPWEREPVV